MSKKATPLVNEFPWLATGNTKPHELSDDQRKTLGIARYRKGDPNPKSSFFGTWHHHGNSTVMNEQVSKIKKIPNISVVVCGNEKGQNNNDGHWQFVVTMSKPMRWRTFSKLVEGAHVEIAKNVQACRRYCKKEWLEGSFEIDNRKDGQGKRSDLSIVADAVKAGLPLGDIAEQYTGTYIRYHQGIQAAQLQLTGHRKNWTKMLYLHGPAGTGKSALMKACFPRACYMSVNGQGFVQYTGDNRSPVYIFDDPEMEPKSISSAFMKQLGNHTAVSLNVKGGRIAVSASLVIIICNYPPETWNWDDAAISRIKGKRGWTVLMDKPIDDGKASIPKDYPTICLGKLAVDHPALKVQVPLGMGKYELPSQSDDQFVDMLKSAYEEHKSLSPKKTQREIIAIEPTASPVRDVVPETPPHVYRNVRPMTESPHHIFWQSSDEEDLEDNQCDFCNLMYEDKEFDKASNMCNDCVSYKLKRSKRRRRCQFIDDEAGESD